MKRLAARYPTSRFVTVSELLDAGEPDAKPECYELRPGDNLRYDALFGEGTE